MADSKLSELTAITSANAGDSLYIVNSSSSKRITASNLYISMTQFRSAPANVKGVAGDKKGMTAFDNSYYYVCITNYSSGTDNIWRRVALTTW